LKQLEAGQYGQVWGVNRVGHIYVRTGVTQGAPWGRGWKRVKTAKTWRRISIGIGAVFGVATNGKVYRTVPRTGGNIFRRITMCKQSIRCFFSTRRFLFFPPEFLGAAIEQIQKRINYFIGLSYDCKIGKSLSIPFSERRSKTCAF
jgi:hypothetical protein